MSERGYTLPRSARLQRREQFSAALAAGETRARRYFTVYVKPNGLSHARIGIIASRRAARRAVDRNRMKRMVRELFRTMPERAVGIDIVVQLRRCSPRGSSAAARAELSRLLEEFVSRPRGS